MTLRARRTHQVQDHKDYHAGLSTLVQASTTIAAVAFGFMTIPQLANLFNPLQVVFVFIFGLVAFSASVLSLHGLAKKLNITQRFLIVYNSVPFSFMMITLVGLSIGFYLIGSNIFFYSIGSVIKGLSDVTNQFGDKLIHISHIATSTVTSTIVPPQTPVP